MALELKQQLKLTQQLVMTPQLQQAIKLLQLSRLELVTNIQQELEQNPVLEEDFADLEELPEELSSEQEIADEAPSERSTDLETPEREVSDADKIADVEWLDYLDSNPQTGLSVIRDDDRPSIDATTTRRPTLQEHLQWQMQLSSFSEDEKLAAAWILGNLDDDGYLQATVEELVRQSGADEATIESSLTKIQALDPAGVAARDLRESLLLQLDALRIVDPLVRNLVENQLDRLQNRDFRGIAREMGVSIEEAAAAANVIANLDPRPARAFGGDEPIYITPDIYVYKIADDFHVVLNEDGLPKLKINRLYRDVLARRRDVERETRAYVQEKIRSAQWLIKSIHQRQRTIYKVMTSIVRYQREFFEKGVAYLKPLNLRDVADDIEMHESTVSRVTTNKYVQTPHGVFELKFFFNSSIKAGHGDSIASESVKEKIRALISGEDTKKPFSDQKIAELLLKREEITIARRTVTKYREAMRILSSTRRREFS